MVGSFTQQNRLSLGAPHFIECICCFQVSIPAWFTVDTKLGGLAIHLDTPQCFSAEMYSVDLNIPGKPEDDKVYIYF